MIVKWDFQFSLDDKSFRDQYQAGSEETAEAIYSCDGMVSRGMAEIEVALSEDYKLNTATLTQNLCYRTDTGNRKAGSRGAMRKRGIEI